MADEIEEPTPPLCEHCIGAITGTSVVQVLWFRCRVTQKLSCLLRYFHSECVEPWLAIEALSGRTWGSAQAPS